MAYSYRLIDSEILNAMHGIGGAYTAIFWHDQDAVSNPEKSYEWHFYNEARPDRGLIGWGCSGALTAGLTNGAPVLVNEGTLTNVTAGDPQLPYDRTKGPFDADNQAIFFDTSANAFDGSTLGVHGDFIPSYATEIGFDDSTPVDTGQQLYQFQVQSRSDTDLDEWLGHELDVFLFAGVPGENGSGVNPIQGPAAIAIGVARGFETPTITSAAINAGAANSFQYAASTVAAGNAEDLPGLSVHPEEGTEFDNLGKRVVISGAFFRSASATEGLAIMGVPNPYTNSLDFTLGDVLIVKESVWQQIHAAIGYNCMIFRVGGFVSAGPFSGNNSHDFLSELRDTSDPTTAPYGDYRLGFIESMDDWQRNMHTILDIHLGTSASPGETAYPSLYIHAHWSGYGYSLAEAELIRATERRALKYGMDHPNPAHGYPEPAQVWLYNAAYVDPWDGVPVSTMLTGRGTQNYVRNTGTQFAATGEVWGSGRAYAVGDVVCDPNAADLMIGNDGWYFCKAGGAHTSAASGSNGPPSDGSQTRWTKCDLRLNDNGKQYEARQIWNALREALEDSGHTDNSTVGTVPFVVQLPTGIMPSLRQDNIDMVIVQAGNEADAVAMAKAACTADANPQWNQAVVAQVAEASNSWLGFTFKVRWTRPDKTLVKDISLTVASADDNINDIGDDLATLLGGVYNPVNKSVVLDDTGSGNHSLEVNCYPPQSWGSEVPIPGAIVLVTHNGSASSALSFNLAAFDYVIPRGIACATFRR